MLAASAFLAIKRLKEQQLSQRAVAKKLGIDRQTVKKYWELTQEEYESMEPAARPKRVSTLEPYRKFIEKEFITHGENCDVVRQRLWQEKHVTADMRTLQRFVKPLRDKRRAERAEKSEGYLVIETAPGLLMQIDFGEKDVTIGGKVVRVHFFAATLCYSRRVYVEAFMDEIQDCWLGGVERAFKYFGGKPSAILCDNAKALVSKPARGTKKECHFNETYRNFCSYWDVTPVASHPYYPQSKGKVERMVGYIKRNCFAGHTFESFVDLGKHIKRWMAEVSDIRVMQHLVETEEPVPIKRFELEKRALRPVDKPLFRNSREVYRKVSIKGLLSVDNCHYQMTADYRNTEVRVVVNGDELTVYRGTTMIRTFHRTLDAVKHNMIESLLTAEGDLGFGATDTESLIKLKDSVQMSNPLLETGELGQGLELYEIVAGGKIDV